MQFIDYLYIYFGLGMLVSIPMARNYWKNFRRSDHKVNIIHPLKIVNRLIDSYVFIIAWLLYTVTYPFYWLGWILKSIFKLIKRIREKREKCKTL